MATQFSKNFTYEELIKSGTATLKKINNTPPPREKENLRRLALEVLQPIRDKYGKPIKINSGYRCPELNKAVGGVPGSFHMSGEAADIKAPNGDNKKLWDLILGMIKTGELNVGELIWEYGNRYQPSWIHISLPTVKKVNKIIYKYGKN